MKRKDTTSSSGSSTVASYHDFRRELDYLFNERHLLRHLFAFRFQAPVMWLARSCFRSEVSSPPTLIIDNVEHVVPPAVLATGDHISFDFLNHQLLMAACSPNALNITSWHLDSAGSFHRRDGGASRAVVDAPQDAVGFHTLSDDGSTAIVEYYNDASTRVACFVAHLQKPPAASSEMATPLVIPDLPLCFSCQLSYDGSRFGYVRPGDIVRVYDTASQSLLYSLDLSRDEPHGDVCSSADKFDKSLSKLLTVRRVPTASATVVVKLWDLTSQQLEREWTGSWRQPSDSLRASISEDFSRVAVLLKDSPSIRDHLPRTRHIQLLQLSSARVAPRATVEPALVTSIEIAHAKGCRSVGFTRDLSHMAVVFAESADPELLCVYDCSLLLSGAACTVISPNHRNWITSMPIDARAQAALHEEDDHYLAVYF